MNACNRDLSAASTSALACSRVSDSDCRPSCPCGVSTSAETFRRTKVLPPGCVFLEGTTLSDIPVIHGDRGRGFGREPRCMRAGAVRGPKIGPRVVRVGSEDAASDAVPSACRSAAGLRRYPAVMTASSRSHLSTFYAGLSQYGLNNPPLKKMHPVEDIRPAERYA